MDRKPAPDILKGIAVILMIQVHLTELFATSGFYGSLAGKVSLFLGGPPAAPVFMAVMGYFLAFSNRSVVQQLIRGIKLLLLGLVLNICLNAHAIIQIVKGNLNLNPFHLLFGMDILFLAGLSIILIASLKPLLQKHFAVPLIAACLAAACSYFFAGTAGTGEVKDYFIAVAGGKFEWSYFPLFPWLAYPLAGYAYKMFEEKFPPGKFHKGLLGALIIVLLVFVMISIKYGITISSNLKSYYHHDIVFTLWVFCFLMLWSGLIWLISKRFKTSWIFRSLIWIGKNVTAFYVVQWIVIGNIATAIYRTQDWPWLILWFAGITGLTALIVWLWKKTSESGRKDRVF